MMNDNNTYTELKPFFERLMDMSADGRYVFRGYGLQEHLYPSIIRKEDFRRFEFQLLGEFEKSGSLHGTFKNHVDLLADAQHFGLPTRLLDFTYNPFIALSFATHTLKNGQEDGDDSIYYYLLYAAVDNCSVVEDLPVHITSKSNNVVQLLKGGLMGSLSDKAQIGIHRAIEEHLNESTDVDSLLLLDPRQSNIRVMMQQGLFMIPCSLEKEEHLRIIKGNTEVLRVHKDLRREIRQRLDGLGFNASRLMPDLASLCEDLKHRYREIL